MFSTTDCWLLFSIGFGKKGANLERIIADGDRINHAIFTREELETGINNLINNDFIILTGNRFFATEKAKQFYSKHKKILKDTSKNGSDFQILCAVTPLLTAKINCMS